MTTFSPSELYLTDGNQVQVLSAQTLAARRAFAITPGSTFVGIAPSGAFVTTSKDGTSWWDPATGARLRTIPGALQRVSWSADGALGVATRSDALLVVFRESDGQVLLELPLFAPLSTATVTSSRPERRLRPRRQARPAGHRARALPERQLQPAPEHRARAARRRSRPKNPKSVRRRLSDRGPPLSPRGDAGRLRHPAAARPGTDPQIRGDITRVSLRKGTT